MSNIKHEKIGKEYKNISSVNRDDIHIDTNEYIVDKSFGFDKTVKESEGISPIDIVDFSNITVDYLASGAIDKKILQKILSMVKIPDFDNESGCEIIPEQKVVSALHRLVEVIAKLESRLMFLETLFKNKRIDGRNTSYIDIIAREDPVRKAIQRIETCDVATVIANSKAFGRNWWPPEELNGKWWRWSGPKKHSTVLVPSAGNDTGRIFVEVGSFGNQTVKETFDYIRPTFYLDDQRIEFEGIEHLDHDTVATISAPFSFTHGALPTHYVFHIYLENLQRPSDEISESKDARWLGINLRQITVSAASEG